MYCASVDFAKNTAIKVTTVARKTKGQVNAHGSRNCNAYLFMLFNCLYNEAVGSLDYIASMVELLLNNELERV